MLLVAAASAAANVCGCRCTLLATTVTAGLSSSICRWAGFISARDSLNCVLKDPADVGACACAVDPSSCGCCRGVPQSPTPAVLLASSNFFSPGLTFPLRPLSSLVDNRFDAFRSDETGSDEPPESSSSADSRRGAASRGGKATLIFIISKPRGCADVEAGRVSGWDIYLRYAVPKVRGTQMRDGTQSVAISRSMGAARRGLWPSAPMEWPATVRRACVSTDLNQHNTITAPVPRSSNSYVQARHICSYRRWVPSFLPEPAQKVQKKRPGRGRRRTDGGGTK